MKKQILLALTVCCLIGSKGFAQNKSDDKKLTFGVSIGAAIPLSAYGSKNTDTTQAAHNDSTHRENGYASSGFHFDVTAGYRFTNNIGAMILIGGNMNSFDATTYSTVNDVKSPATYTSTSYYVGQYLIGPFVSFPAGDKLRIDIRVLVGLMMANTPTGTTTETIGSQTATGVYSGNGGSGFGYQFGAGIRYNFTDMIGLLVNVDYAGSTLSYTGYSYKQTSPYFNYTVTNTTLKATMALGLITTAVGVSFSF
ncbi:MAG TPA: outer membrane beta-barrel protein [Bacteroidia bacterium]|nr:outer membrane beta-barrel protein [Bacteroidia bacterium]